MSGAVQTLLTLLARPAAAGPLAAADWRQLVAAARALNLLGLLAERLRQAGVQPAPQIQRHLDGAAALSARQRLSVRWEAQCLQDALGPLGVPVLLLKGSAYVMAGHAVSVGRLFGDVDILVPRQALAEVESRLLLSGWTPAKTDDYDQRYYRQWMHELPPLVNVRRGTVLDVHHTILPLTARNTPDPAQLLARSQPLAGFDTLRVPSPEDLVLHSLVHLTHEGELHNGLRDLADIDGLLRAFGDDAGFWERLQRGAAGNDLARPAWLGLLLAREWFASPVPETVLGALAPPAAAPLRLPPLLGWAYRLSLPAPALSRAGMATQLAQLLIYLRAHQLRMPLPLLLRHLARKGWRSWFSKAEAKA